jgi:cyanate lyase
LANILGFRESLGPFDSRTAERRLFFEIGVELEFGVMPASVAEHCSQHGLSAADLISRSGLDPHRVQAILLGRWTPSPSERQKIAAALGLAIDDIAWGHVTPIQHLYGHGPG